MNQMAAVELGADRDGQPQAAHRRLGHGPVRHRSDEIAAEPDEHLGAPLHHRLYGVDDMVTMSARRLEAEHFLDLVQQCRLWLFVDADGAVALHVRMAADRADPSSGLAEIPAQQQQIYHLLHVCGTEAVLGDPHAVDDDDGARPHIDGRHALQLFARQTADAQYVFPIGLAEIVCERLEAVCLLRDEIEIEHWFIALAKRLVMRFQHQLHDALESRDIAADAELAILAGDPRLAEGCHLDRILGRRKAFKRALPQRVEYDDRHVAARRPMQLGQHPRAVGARVLTDDEDRLGMCEIVEHHGPLADADAFGKADAGRLVAHIRAIGKIVRAEAAREQLIHERRLVRGASRSVKFGLVRIVEGIELATDQCERLVPTDRHIMVGRGIVTHRLGQTPLLFQPIVAFLFEFADGVGREELARHAALGQLPGDGLGAIFAELE